MCTRSEGRQPPVARGNARAAAFAPMSVRLPTVHQRTPTQSRCYILDNIHCGLTRGALVLECESPPACAKWRFLLHACSPTNAHAQERGASRPPWSCVGNANGKGSCDFCDARTRVHQERGGRQPPVVHGNARCKRRGAIVRDTSDRRTGERQRSHGTATPTAGSRPPLLCRNANVCRRNCHFCDGRTHVLQERGASAPRGLR
jgi:hypothetical protein